MKNILYLLLISIISFNDVSGQVSPWSDSCVSGSFVGKIDGLNRQSAFRNVYQLSGGDIIVTGNFEFQTVPNQVSKEYGVVMRLSPAGKIKWKREIGYNNSNYATDFGVACSVLSNNGDIIVVGNENQTYNQGGMFIIRIDANGNLIWKHRYIPFDPNEVAEQIIEVSDGGFLIPGITSGFCSVLKINSSGNILWNRNFSLDAYLNLRTITESPTAYYLTGYSYDYGDQTQDVLVKLNPQNGSIIWSKGFLRAKGDTTEYAFKYLEYKNGLLHLTGSTQHNYIANHGANMSAQCYLSFTENGNIVELKRIEIPNFASAFTAVGDGLRTFDINTKTGMQFNYEDTSDFYIYKLDNQFGQQWAWRFFYPGREEPLDMQIMSDSSVAICGSDISPGVWRTALLIKTSSIGRIGNCNSASFQVRSSNLTSTVNDVNVFAGVATTDSFRTAFISVFDTANFQWNLECNSQIICRLGRISGSDIVCVNSPVSYKSIRSGACKNPITFHTSSSTQINNITDTSSLITFLNSGKVTLYAQMQTDCGILKDSLIITVLPAMPAVNLGPDKYLCQPSVTLHAGSGYKTYDWGNGNHDSLLTLSTTGSYHVMVTDYCNSITSDTVNVLPAQLINYHVANDTLICKGDSLPLIAPSGYQNYQWNPSYNLIQQDSLHIKVFPIKDTFYISTAQTNYGCDVLDTVFIKIKFPSILSAGSDTSICQYDSVRFSATPGFVSYLWNTGNTSSFIFANKPGTYTIAATNNSGCVSTDTVKLLNVYPLPAPVISRYQNICSNAPRILTTQFQYASYSWQDGSNNASFIANDTGLYRVTVVDVNGCKGNDSLTIKQFVSPPTNFLFNDTAVCLYVPIELKSSGMYQSYLWNTGAKTRSISINQSGIYSLKVVDQNDCKGTDSINVENKKCSQLILFPNAITDNGDYRNDIFIPFVSGNLIKYKLTIFNRFGKPVFETKDYKIGWDGKLNGLQQPMGVYVFNAEYQFEGNALQILKGTVTLLR